MKGKKVQFRALRSSLVLLFVVILLLTNIHSVLASGVTISGKDSGLTLNDNRAIFNATNLLPGDTRDAQFTVTNDGLNEFTLVLSTLPHGEDLMLYEKLVLEIKDAQGNQRYRDSVSGLENGLELGKAAPGSQEKYYLTLCFPSESGTEFEDRQANFDLIFKVKNASGAIQDLPVTGNNINWLIPVGLVAVGTGFLMFKLSSRNF